jgi:hypothetical protein
MELGKIVKTSRNRDGWRTERGARARGAHVYHLVFDRGSEKQMERKGRNILITHNEWDRNTGSFENGTGWVAERRTAGNEDLGRDATRRFKGCRRG